MPLPAVVAAGIVEHLHRWPPAGGQQDLLVRSVKSVTTVQVALGHPSAVETLQIYVGLWPDNDQRTRAAIDDLDLNQPTAGAVGGISCTG